MRTILVTGSDTGIGKTRVVGALARLLGKGGASVQIVKVVETGGSGDAGRAAAIAGGEVAVFTLLELPAPLAPAAAARLAGAPPPSVGLLAGKVRALPDCDWRICEGAGGIASPIDSGTGDWADFGAALGVDATVIVVPDRLGAINQGRLAFARAAAEGLRSGIWLNAAEAVDADVAASNREGLRGAGIPLWAEQAHGAELPEDVPSLLSEVERTACLGEAQRRRVPHTLFSPPELRSEQASRGEPLHPELTRQGKRTGDSPLHLPVASRRQDEVIHLAASRQQDIVNAGAAGAWLERCRAALSERERQNLRRTLRVAVRRPGDLNLADNDYLDLARDPALAEAAVAQIKKEGTSASASPLITGWRESHAQLVAHLCTWQHFSCGLLWTSGYAANAAVLGGLPQKGDLVLADRLIHHSMIGGLLRSGATLVRYPHLDLDRLEKLLAERASGATFVVTESVFSMDGDYPDMARLAGLKRRFGFCWVVDEAHGLGWYGPEGAGVARAAGVEADVDVLVGTLGKALGSGGAYTLFRETAVRDFLVNTAGEFIYSTAIPPANAAIASAALGRMRELAGDQPAWHAASRAFRAALRAAGWNAPEGESPIVPVGLGDENAAVGLAGALGAAGIQAAAVRPPTVPAGTSRLRFSLKRTFSAADSNRVLAAMESWRKARSLGSRSSAASAREVPPP